jgi:hypothetical protein
MIPTAEVTLQQGECGNLAILFIIEWWTCEEQWSVSWI